MVEPHEEAPNSDTARWKAFVTQTDWSGPVMRDSWYGHGNTCNRIAMFVHLSALCSTMALAFHGFQHWPILYPYLTVQEMDQIQQSHGDCLQAICQAVEHIEFDCQMTTHGRLVMSPPVSIDRVPLPLECHNAIRLTFGETFEYDLLNKPDFEESDDPTILQPHTRQIDLIHFQDVIKGKTGRNDNIPIFQVVSDECLVQERLVEFLFFDDIFWGPASGTILMELVDVFAMQPGDHQRIELRSYACPKYMPRPIRDEVLPKSKQLYNFFWTWRRSGIVCFMYWFNMAYYSAMSATRIFFLVLPSIGLWFLLPKDEFRGRRISYFSTISTLLLLTTLTDEGSGGLDEMIRTAIVVTAALSFGNQKAAMEWTFLFFLSYMDLGSLSITWEKAVRKELHHLADPSKTVVSWIEMLVSYLIPGFGLWKIVLLYAIYMSFPSKRREERSKQD